MLLESGSLDWQCATAVEAPGGLRVPGACSDGSRLAGCCEGCGLQRREGRKKSADEVGERVLSLCPIMPFVNQDLCAVCGVTMVSVHACVGQSL